MIVATPLDLPIIKPDNWDVFWNIWHTYAKDLTKVKMNLRSPVPVSAREVWTGLDIFKSDKGYDISWSAPFYDIKDDLPIMSNTIRQLPFAIERVRIIQSVKNIPAHSDDSIDWWNIRAMFHYTDPNQQWFFTRPGDRSEKFFLNMPEDTNWFAYNDSTCWHGSVYNEQHRKLLIQVYLLDKDITALLNSSIKKYKEYTIKL
jgi:hypothetical protein